MKGPRYTWRKIRYRWDRVSHELFHGGIRLAIVSEIGKRWYWYTMSESVPFKNTAQDSVKTIDAAKAECKAYVLANRVAVSS